MIKKEIGSYYIIAYLNIYIYIYINGELNSKVLVGIKRLLPRSLK